MSTGAGQLCMDREQFEVGYAVKQLLLGWITGKAVEIMSCSVSGMDKKQAVELPFACPFKTNPHGRSSPVDQLKSIQGERTVKHIAFMMDHMNAVEIACAVVAMISNNMDNA